jgi:hypothetical protein
MPGIAALIAYWAQIMDEDQHERDFVATQQFLESLSEGLKAIG